MVVCEQRNFLFIHIPKTGGSSITSVLTPYCYSPLGRLLRICFKSYRQRRPWPFDSHDKAEKVFHVFGAKKFEALYSFAFVRNPWDWNASLYSYILKNKTHHSHEQVVKLGSFDSFMKWRVARPFNLQKNYICNQNGKLLINAVGRYENIATDFALICRKLGFKTRLPFLNRGTLRHDFRECYSPALRDLVAQHFAEDIRLFGYDFEAVPDPGSFLVS